MDSHVLVEGERESESSTRVARQQVEPGVMPGGHGICQRGDKTSTWRDALVNRNMIKRHYSVFKHAELSLYIPRAAYLDVQRHCIQPNSTTDPSHGNCPDV